MIYKKIILKPKSWLITPLESDTILSYIFAYNFEKLEHIYKKFQDWNNLPFLITNWFLENTLPRPMYFCDVNNELHEKTTLIQDINSELDKKKIKKLTNIPFDKSILELIFTWKQDELRGVLKNNSDKKEKIEIKSIEIVSEYKNSIPRFNIWETNPFEITDINYISVDL